MRIAGEQGAVGPCEVLDLLLPALGIGRAGRVHLADRPLEHQVDELVLVAHVPVQRCRARPELLRQAPHGKRIEAFAVQHGERGVDDRLAAERRAPLLLVG